jgi:hypothetical protein
MTEATRDERDPAKPRAPSTAASVTLRTPSRAAAATQLLAAEPHATAERKRELRTEAVKKARQSPLFFDLTISLSKSISIFHFWLSENARLARQSATATAIRTGPAWPPRSTR